MNASQASRFACSELNSYSSAPSAARPISSAARQAIAYVEEALGELLGFTGDPEFDAN